MLVAKLVSFALSGAGRVVLLGAAFVLWTGYQRYDATKDCEDANLLIRLQEVQRQLSTAERISREARGRADKAEAELVKTTEAKDALLQQAKDQGLSCPIDGDVRNKLRAIQ